ncbi:MAG: tRNA uridine-5-carboxymethylaminomethyl(34) synthesis GTPase MnmE [Pseudobdellovibrionaceae bacterium]
MINALRDEQTICAVSTPHGVGGVSIVRVSGPKALISVRALSAFLPKAPKSHHAYLGYLKDPKNDQIIDQVLVTYFAEKKSYTGEEVLEISCHGSPYICQKILQCLVDQGCRIADKGEFTYRSFINDKIDLIQAESVLSLIQSQNAYSAKLALQQLDGHLSDKIKAILDSLTWVLASIEANIDFSTEGFDPVALDSILRKISSTKDVLEALVSSYSYGRILKDGIRVVLAGRPNVGKSSWLNIFAEQDKAIVTPIAGTTRDIIEAEVFYKNLKISFFDTAGLRADSGDLVESLGIKKSYEYIQKADAVIYIFDVTTDPGQEELGFLSKLNAQKLVILVNKCELNTPIVKKNEFLNICKNFTNCVLFTDIHDSVSRELVLAQVHGLFNTEDLENTAVISQARHYECLQEALSLVNKSIEALQADMAVEFVSVDLKMALMQIQQVLGLHFDDQIMDRVFKEFCIGK